MGRVCTHQMGTGRTGGREWNPRIPQIRVDLPTWISPRPGGTTEGGWARPSQPLPCLPGLGPTPRPPCSEAPGGSTHTPPKRREGQWAGTQPWSPALHPSVPLHPFLQQTGPGTPRPPPPAARKAGRGPVCSLSRARPAPSSHPGQETSTSDHSTVPLHPPGAAWETDTASPSTQPPRGQRQGRVGSPSLLSTATQAPTRESAGAPPSGLAGGRGPAQARGTRVCLCRQACPGTGAPLGPESGGPTAVRGADPEHCGPTALADAALTG